MLELAGAAQVVRKLGGRVGLAPGQVAAWLQAVQDIRDAVVKAYGTETATGEPDYAKVGATLASTLASWRQLSRELL